MKRQICSILLFIFCVTLQAQLVTYPEGLKANMPHNDDYTVRVRIPGGEWEDLFEYNVQVDMDAVQNASMVQFDMNGTVEVMVKKNNGTVREVCWTSLNICQWNLMGTDFIICIFLPIRWKQRFIKKQKKVSCISDRVFMLLWICQII